MTTKLRSAFGMELSENQFGSLDGAGVIGSVGFWRETHGWCGQLRVGDVVLSENIGSVSARACYQSLRGRARNLMRGLVRVGVKP